MVTVYAGLRPATNNRVFRNFTKITVYKCLVYYNNINYLMIYKYIVRIKL